MAIPKTWAKIQPLEASVNLSDITTEQLAESMQEKQKSRNTLQEEKQKPDTGMYEKSDELMAYKLQNEFNQEYNDMLKRTEEVVNRGSKVGISYTNYRLSSYDIKDESGDESNMDFDRFVSVEKELASIPRCGYKKVEGGSDIITKHDTLMSSRMNACRVLQFPPGINTGDTGGFDMRLDNKVYNSLRAHQHAQTKKGKTSTKPKTHPK